MDDLIARLEAATEGSRELDISIGDAAELTPDWFYGGKYDSAKDPHSWPPPYTTSLDAAKTLYDEVPERIPSDARLACIEALKARHASS